MVEYLQNLEYFWYINKVDKTNSWKVKKESKLIWCFFELIESHNGGFFSTSR